MNVKDVAGNTTLHLAVSNRKWQVVEYLLEKIETAEKTKNRMKAVNAENNFGYTAYDTIMEIEEMTEPLKKIKATFRKLKAKDPSQLAWLLEKRDALLVVASLFATMNFQAGLNPPGGFWQDNTPLHRAGEAILGYSNPNTYSSFIRGSTIGLVASLTTIWLLLHEWPFKNEFFMWLLVMSMWVAVTSIAFTYVSAILVFSPEKARETLSHTIVVGDIVWWGVIFTLFIAQAIRVMNWKLMTKTRIQIWPEIKKFFNNSFRQVPNSGNGEDRQMEPIGQGQQQSGVNTNSVDGNHSNV